MDLFHNEIISFCLRKATIKLASGSVPVQCLNFTPLCAEALPAFMVPLVGSVVDPNSFFFVIGSTTFFRIQIQIRILIILFLPKIFKNGASHCFRMCSEPVRQRKKFFNRKMYVFSLS
jgi:hypothetical protein